MLLRLLLGTGTLFLSIVLGALALVYVGINYPETLTVMLSGARDVKDMITGTSLDPHYNIWVQFLLDERQLLLLFFTICARAVLAILTWPFFLAAGR